MPSDLTFITGGTDPVRNVLRKGPQHSAGNYLPTPAGVAGPFAAETERQQPSADMQPASCALSSAVYTLHTCCLGP